MNSQDRIVAEARRWIGTPYQHQGSMIQCGADCLGLFRGVWRALVGQELEEIPPYTQDWSEISSHEVMLLSADLWLRRKPIGSKDSGDVLVFRMRHGGFAKHLGISTMLAGRQAFVHSYSGHGVVETSLSRPWEQRIAGRFEFPMEKQ